MNVTITVAKDFDQTTVRYRSWDEVFLDEDVERLLRMVYDPPPDVDFADSVGVDTASSYYTPPYCSNAIRMGYACHEKYYKKVV